MNFQVGQRVVRLIRCAGVETASIYEVQKVSRKKGFVYLDADDLSDDGPSTYRDVNGSAVASWVAGVSHRIVALEEEAKGGRDE